MADTEAVRKGKRRAGITSAALGTVVGLVAASVVGAHLAGLSVPSVADDRTAFVVLAVVGMVMCGFGIQTIIHSTGLLSPASLIGAIIGLLILITFVAALLGRPMPVLADYREGFVALAVAILIKWSVSTAGLIAGLVKE